MDMSDEIIRQAVASTQTLRPPRRSLDTFGTTNIYYYLLTEPAYGEMSGPEAETVIREGRVIAERPQVVTQYYLSHLQGFSPEARKYFEMLIQEHGATTPGLFYKYRNEPKELNIVTDSLYAVFEKLNAQIEERGDPLTSIIKGEDTLWDVSLMKFIFEITRQSLPDNLNQMGRQGRLKMDRHGVPADARVKIEELFYKVQSGQGEPRELKDELDRWGVFNEYEDRFFNLFGSK